MFTLALRAGSTDICLSILRDTQFRANTILGCDSEFEESGGPGSVLSLADNTLFFILRHARESVQLEFLRNPCFRDLVNPNAIETWDLQLSQNIPASVPIWHRKFPLRVDTTLQNSRTSSTSVFAAGVIDNSTNKFTSSLLESALQAKCSTEVFQELLNLDKLTATTVNRVSARTPKPSHPLCFITGTRHHVSLVLKPSSQGNALQSTTSKNPWIAEKLTIPE